MTKQEAESQQLHQEKQPDAQEPFAAADSGFAGAVTAYNRLTGDRPVPLKPTDLLSLQRTIGNRAVQRTALTQPGRPAKLQRSPATSEAVSSEITGWQKTVHLDRDLGYITLNEITATGKGEYTIITHGPADADTQQKHTVTGEVTNPGFGFKEETKKVYEESVIEAVSGFKPALSGSSQLDNKGGKLTFEGALEGQQVGFAVEFAILDIQTGDPAKAIDVDVLMASFKQKVPLIKDYQVEGGEGRLDCVAEFAIGFTPNYKKIAQYVLAEFGAAALAEAAFVGGSVAAGVALAVGACITLIDVNELGEIPEQVGRAIISYAKGYNDTMHSEKGSGDLNYFQGVMDALPVQLNAIAS
ncbi:MAG: hypothetical protein KDE04_13410, partial [Anaerolineales bacterium]|nr:hypothetical protein [Anaerolineales bacterium]